MLLGCVRMFDICMCAHLSALIYCHYNTTSLSLVSLPPLYLSQSVNKSIFIIIIDMSSPFSNSGYHIKSKTLEKKRRCESEKGKKSKGYEWNDQTGATAEQTVCNKLMPRQPKFNFHFISFLVSTVIVQLLSLLFLALLFFWPFFFAKLKKCFSAPKYHTMQ